MLMFCFLILFLLKNRFYYLYGLFKLSVVSDSGPDSMNLNKYKTPLCHMTIDGVKTLSLGVTLSPDYRWCHYL